MANTTCLMTEAVRVIREGYMNNTEYDKTEGVRRSELFTIINKTPMHFLHEQMNPKEDTPSLAFGRAVHKAILEPDTFFKEYDIAPKVNKRTKEGKAAIEEHLIYCEENSKEPIDQDDLAIIKDMKVVIDKDPLASAFLTGEHEKAYFWTDDATGEKCKVKLDCISEVNGKKYIVDYKTTDSCEQRAFERSVRKYGYKFQSGMYREGYFQNTFEDVGFAFVAQEKTAPYAVRVFICSEDFLDEGYSLFREAIGILHDCKVNNHYWGYEGPNNDVAELLGEEEDR